MKKNKIRFGKKLLMALLPSFLLCFMYIVWGSMEVYTGNAGNFRFSYLDASLRLWPVCLACTAGLTLLLSLLPGRAFRVGLAFTAAFCAASYVQNAFLNLDLGLLDGEEVDWARYTAHGWRNLAVWAAMLAGVTGLLLFFRKRAVQAALLLCGALLAMQLTAFATVSVQHIASGADEQKKDAYVLSGEKQFTVSAQKNVIVILLDYFSNDYIDNMLRVYPDGLDALRDFTYYDNCDPTYIGTFPSVVHMLTGHEFDTGKPIDTWFREAWSSDSCRYFFQTLQDNDYKLRFFDSSTTYFGIRYAQPYIDNLVNVGKDYTVRGGRLVERMVQLSLYRYLPHVFKEGLHMTTSNFTSVVTMQGGEVVNCKNKVAYYQEGLRRTPLTAVEGDGNYLTVQFLLGMHPPYHMDENVITNYDVTQEQCARGYMRIVAEYLQQLKDLGLYDDATIIITSDHGDKENSMQVLYFIKEANVTREQMAVSSAPISHKEFQGTILRAIGAESPYGQSIYDFADGERRERTVMRNYIDTNYPAVPKYLSTTTGTHTVMYAYTYTGDRHDLRKQIRRGPSEILPLTESFN